MFWRLLGDYRVEATSLPGVQSDDYRVEATRRLLISSYLTPGVQPDDYCVEATSLRSDY